MWHLGFKLRSSDFSRLVPSRGPHHGVCALGLLAVLWPIIRLVLDPWKGTATAHVLEPATRPAEPRLCPPSQAVCKAQHLLNPQPHQLSCKELTKGSEQQGEWLILPPGNPEPHPSLFMPNPLNTTISLLIKISGVRGMYQQLQALVTLSEDLGSTPSTQTEAHNYL